MNSLQDSRREEGQDEENPSSKNTENGSDADIRKNDFSSSTEPIPSSPPQVITAIVDDFENPISVTNSVIDPSATAIDTAAMEAKGTGSTDVMAVEPTNCTTEPGTSKSYGEKHVGSEVGATAFAAESYFLDVKLETQMSGDEERLGKVDMVLDPTISHTETAAPKRGREEQLVSEEMSTDSTSEEEHQQNSHNPQTSGTPNKSSDAAKPSSEEEGEEPPPKKQKQLSLLSPNTPATAQQPEPSQGGALSESNTANGNGSSKNGKKSSSKKKTKNNNVWTKPTSRKGKKKSKNNNSQSNPKVSEDTVWITPAPRFPDKNDDSADANICLSRVYKAEKVELSDDRLIAGSCKGYRMVRATRGVTEGAWFFEIKVVSLGETGHTRLGWSTDKGDLQAPVGYDANSFGYRDIDGCKIHKAVRDKYGEEGYKEGDVIGFYISLPEGNLYAPKPPRYVLYKGQRYVCAPDSKEEPPKIIPGSEISFFKNGRGQGVAFKDLQGGRYYPAASMYTLPNQPNCVVKFNFGPDFECFPEDFGGRPAPRPMIDVPYQGFDSQVENGDSSEKNQ